MTKRKSMISGEPLDDEITIIWDAHTGKKDDEVCRWAYADKYGNLPRCNHCHEEELELFLYKSISGRGILWFCNDCILAIARTIFAGDACPKCGFGISMTGPNMTQTCTFGHISPYKPKV